MNKENIIDSIVAKHRVSKTLATAIVTTIFDEIQDAVVAGDKVTLQGFGVFCATHAKARVGNNPVTKQRFEIAATRKPQFTAGIPFKNAVKANPGVAALLPEPM